MPGVPSSRGCDACRKQKKKCVAVSPPCLRCSRLKIPCLRLGQKRYKFLNQEQHLPTTNSSALQPSHSVCNGLTALTSAFVHIIDPSVDIGFNLPVNFGGFLLDIPRRLGSNEALDAVSDAFVAAYKSFCVGNASSDRNVLEKHVRALSVLRCCLNDPNKASTSETLCSVQLMMTYQSFLGNNQWFSHSRGIVQIIKNRVYTGPRKGFEEKVMQAQRGSVIVEALLDDKILLSKREWIDLVENKFDEDSVYSQPIRCLARIPSLMQRGRQALMERHHEGTCMSDLVEECRALRDHFQPSIAKLRAYLDEKDLSRLSGVTGNDQGAALLYAIRARSYCFGLSVGIILNRLIESLDPTDQNLREQSLQFSEEIVILAEITRNHRPLGTMYMLICLRAAWAATDNSATKATILSLLTEFSQDLLDLRSRSLTEELEWTAQRFSLSEPCSYESFVRRFR